MEIEGFRCCIAYGTDVIRYLDGLQIVEPDLCLHPAVYADSAISRATFPAVSSVTSASVRKIAPQGRSNTHGAVAKAWVFPIKPVLIKQTRKSGSDCMCDLLFVDHKSGVNGIAEEVENVLRRDNSHAFRRTLRDAGDMW